ncbi:MAG TPA: RNA polymerase sigma factor RpoH [Rhodospirillales bacterium]|jgi:RNA polymerase sigma-32 factor|nr:RNA polymerase sigma factor RpoH [Rhodospirillales bacterium]HIL76483.1 RNA polymerase sigma factor RpoH [Rhodospirillales bacterium]
MAIATLPSLYGDSGLSRYLNEIKAFPILTKGEEFMLAERYTKHDDSEAAHKLVTSHLRLVAKIAMQYRGYGLPVADLISEGNIGLMRAVKKFEPERGFRLSTYAMWWIKASVTEYVLKTWSMVKMGTMAAQKKLFFSLRKAKRRLEIIDNNEINPEQAKLLAQQFNLPEKDIIHMNGRMTIRDQSLNAPVSREEEGSIEVQDTLADSGPSPEVIVANREETEIRSDFLKAALDELPERERDIFIERRLKDDPITLEKIGKGYGISRERVRQLENRAFEKVQKSIHEAAMIA